MQDENGWSPLHACIATASEYSFVKALIDHGANVNIADSAGVTPLHVAAYRVREKPNEWAAEISKLLIKSGADVTLRSQVRSFICFFFFSLLLIINLSLL